MDLEQRQALMRERHQSSRHSVEPPPLMPGFAERHYSVKDLSRMWGLSEDFVRDVFVNEPGVLVLGNDPKPGTRRYRTLRIPESVVERVYRRHINPEGRKC